MVPTLKVGSCGFALLPLFRDDVGSNIVDEHGFALVAVVFSMDFANLVDVVVYNGFVT